MAVAQQVSAPLNARALTMRLMLRNANILVIWLLVFYGTWSAVELLPESLVRSLAFNGITWIWVIGMFAIGAWSARTSHAEFHDSPLQSEYYAQVAPFVERCLLAIGAVAAMSMCGLATTTWFWEPPQWASGVPILATWLCLAMVVPVESGVWNSECRSAKFLGAFAPWMFVFAYPCYMRDRVGGSLRSAAIAGLSIIAMVAGFTVFLLRTEQ